MHSVNLSRKLNECLGNLLNFLQLAESAKAQFSARGFSDHLALVRAFDGWKDAERGSFAYEYCWRNFLSTQTLRAIDSLRKQFLYLLKDVGLVENPESCNICSHDEHFVRAVICAGLFPGICSVVVSKSLYLCSIPFIQFVCWGEDTFLWTSPFSFLMIFGWVILSGAITGCYN